MAERICLLTGNETTCNDSCYKCDCGGEVALNNYYVPIYDIQRVCDMDISLNSKETAEYIRNELEKMTVVKTDVQPVKRGHWINTYQYCKLHGYKPSGMGLYYWCSECDKTEKKKSDFCPNCGVYMRGEDIDTK